jgi:hypothetical protein
MKVSEILHESQILNEQLNTFLRLLEMVVEKGLGTKGLEKALAWLSKAVVGKSASSAAAELAEAWVMSAERMGIDMSAAIATGERQALAAGVDRAVVDSAKTQAVNLAATRQGLASGQGLLARLGNNTQVVKSMLGSKYALLDGLLKTYGIVQPIVECVLEINGYYKRWDSKTDPEYTKNPALLQGDVQLAIDVCIRQILALWAGRKISAFVFGKNGLQMLPFAGGDRMAAVLNTAGAVAKTGFTAWLDSPPGRKAFAEWVVGDTLMAAGFRGVADFISGLIKTGYDKILDAVDSDKAPPKPEPMKPAAERPGQTRYDFATGRALN